MKLSVIIPAYNEENRISRTLLATDDYLRSWNYEYEIIVVNNNSTDNTAAVVLDLKENHAPNIILAHEFVPGKGAAVKKGVAVAQGDYIIFMDADNATPISEIHNFWPLFDGTTDIVIGSRYTEQSNVLVKQPLYRIMLSRLSNLMIQAVLLPGIKDTQVGFKMLTKPAADKIFKNMYTNGWGFDLEVLALGRLYGYSIKEVGVLWREFGGSTLKLNAYIDSLRELVSIRMRVFSESFDKE